MKREINKDTFFKCHEDWSKEKDEMIVSFMNEWCYHAGIITSNEAPLFLDDENPLGNKLDMFYRLALGREYANFNYTYAVDSFAVMLFKARWHGRMTAIANKGRYNLKELRATFGKWRIDLKPYGIDDRSLAFLDHGSIKILRQERRIRFLKIENRDLNLKIYELENEDA